MESFIQNKDIYNICLETTHKYSQHKNRISKDIINLFIKFLIHSKNIYVSKFITTKLKQLHIKSGHILRKLLVEIYVFISVINKPNIENDIFNIKFSKKNVIDEKQFLQNLHGYTREYMFKYVHSLHRSNDEFVWKLILHVSKKREFVEQLQYMYGFTKNVKLLLLAYDTLYDSYYYSVDYNDILLQCMIKIDYIYIEENMINNDNELYTTCMKYIPLKKNVTHKNICDKYPLEEKNIEINNFQKRNTEKLVFEKCFT